MITYDWAMITYDWAMINSGLIYCHESKLGSYGYGKKSLN